MALEKILKSPFVPGAYEFLEKYYSRYNFYIISGTPEEELRFIVKERGLEKFFEGIYGSPRFKAEIINDIILNRRLDRRKIVLIGDAESDRLAAGKTNIIYIERDRSKEFDLEKLTVKNLINFNELLSKIT